MAEGILLKEIVPYTIPLRGPHTEYIESLPLKGLKRFIGRGGQLLRYLCPVSHSKQVPVRNLEENTCIQLLKGICAL